MGQVGHERRRLTSPVPAAEPGPPASSCPSSLGSWQPLAEPGLLSSRGRREGQQSRPTGGLENEPCVQLACDRRPVCEGAVPCHCDSRTRGSGQREATWLGRSLGKLWAGSSRGLGHGAHAGPGAQAETAEAPSVRLRGSWSGERPLCSGQKRGRLLSPGEGVQEALGLREEEVEARLVPLMLWPSRCPPGRRGHSVAGWALKGLRLWPGEAPLARAALSWGPRLLVPEGVFCLQQPQLPTDSGC